MKHYAARNQFGYNDEVTEKVFVYADSIVCRNVFFL